VRRDKNINERYGRGATGHSETSRRAQQAGAEPQGCGPLGWEDAIRGPGRRERVLLRRVGLTQKKGRKRSQGGVQAEHGEGKNRGALSIDGAMR